MRISKRHVDVVKPLDGGWGYVIVAGGIISLFQWGIVIRCFGVFFIEMSERYQASATELSWVGAINMSLAGLFGPLSSALIKRFSHRHVTIAGGLLGCLSMVATAFAPTVEVTYLTYGLLGGLACSLAYTPTFTLVGEYFQRKRATAMGLVSCGTAISTFAAPPLIRFIYEEFNYSGATVIIGAFLLNTCVGGALFRPLDNNVCRQPNEIEESQVLNGESEGHKKVILDHQRVKKILHDDKKTYKKSDHLQNSNEKHPIMKENEKYTENYNNTLEGEMSPTGEDEPLSNGVAIPDQKKNSTLALAWYNFKKYADPSLLVDINMFALNLIQLSLFIMMSLTSAFLPALATDLGYTKMQGAMLLSLSGIGGLLAIPAGFCFDVSVVKRNLLYIYAAVCAVTAILTIATPVVTSLGGLCALTFIKGGTNLIVQSQRATISVKLVGVNRLTNAFGYLLLFSSAGSLIGRSTAGIIRDRFGSYDMAFYLSGVALLMASLFLLGTAIYHQKKVNMQKKQEQVESLA